MGGFGKFILFSELHLLIPDKGTWKNGQSRDEDTIGEFAFGGVGVRIIVDWIGGGNVPFRNSQAEL